MKKTKLVYALLYTHNVILSAYRQYVQQYLFNYSAPNISNSPNVIQRLIIMQYNDGCIQRQAIIAQLDVQRRFYLSQGCGQPC